MFNWKKTLICTLLCTVAALSAQTKRERLEGLVYEVEDWSTPADSWILNKRTHNKWMLWTEEENVNVKRSNGQSLVTPHIKADRKSPAEGAPMLHTRITGIPKGLYQAYLNGSARHLGYSLDGGKTWKKTTLASDVFLGVYDIQDGVFEIWADDCFATPGNLGPAYYDYINLVPFEMPTLYDISTFSLYNGTTQIAWISNVPCTPATVYVKDSKGNEITAKETEEGLRNHAVFIPGLVSGETYMARVELKFTDSLKTQLETTFVAGKRPAIAATKPFSIPLTITEPTDAARTDWPVQSGVPFAQGILASENEVCLKDAAGKPVKAYFQTTATWPDGSVKWLSVAFNATTDTAKPVTYTLENQAFAQQAPPMNANSDDEAAIDRFFKLFEIDVTLGDGRKLKPVNQLVMTPTPFQRPNEYMFAVELATEDNEVTFTAYTTMVVHKTTMPALVDFNWSLVNTTMKKVNIPVKSATLTLRNAYKQWATSKGESCVKNLDVKQFLEKEALVSVDGKTTKQTHFDGYVKLEPAAGKSDVSAVRHVYVHDFAETYPKSMTVTDKTFTLAMLPELPKENYPPENWRTPEPFFMHFYWYKDGAYLWKRGLKVEQRFSFATSLPEQSANYDKWLAEPLFAVCTPEHYCGTKVFGDIDPAAPDYFPEYEESFNKSFERLEAGRVMRGEYGWMNFGDWFGERRWNWGNNEYDLTYTLLIQFARTGDLKLLKRAAEMARHYVTVDTNFAPYEKQHELVYEHCAGHVGDFITKNDPMVVAMGKTNVLLRGMHDGSGGHSHQTGTMLYSCLAAEPRFMPVALNNAWNQALRFTPNYRISIERAVGWSIVNAVSAYNYSHNPYFLNAAKIFVEAVTKTQNPETGCFDLYQDQTECECPDKKEHRGGKAFATGVLLHGLARYYEVTNSPEAKKAIVGCADWLLKYSWNPKRQGFRYKTGCPKYANSGGYSLLTLEGIVYASMLTGDKSYAEFVERTCGRHIRGTSGAGWGAGKSFTQRFRQLPHTFYYLNKVLGIRQTNIYKPSTYTWPGISFTDANGKTSFTCAIDNQEKKSLNVELDILSLDNVKLAPNTVTQWTFTKQGLNWTTPIEIALVDTSKKGVIKGKLTLGKEVFDVQLECVTEPVEPKLGDKVMFFGKDSNFTAKALKAVGCNYDIKPDMNGTSFDGLKSIVIGADSFNRTLPLMTAETAARLFAFCKAGGRVLFMQPNDDAWLPSALPASVILQEPNGKFLSAEKDVPFFKDVDVKKLVGTPCYDSILSCDKAWNVLARDNAKRPAVISLDCGKGQILLVMPSFDRFMDKGEPLNHEECKKVMKNIAAWLTK